MNILCFRGGLGNQMFQYAFYLMHKRKQKGIWMFDISDAKPHHQGFELDRLFGVCRYHKWHRRLVYLFDNLGIKKEYINEKTDVYYNDIPVISSMGKMVLYSGYWQSERYFYEIADEIRKKFRFFESQLNDKSSDLLFYLTNGNRNYVSMHIRRGDYMLYSFWQVCSLDYYCRAIKFIKEHVIDPSFIVFSDDISWCKETFSELCDIVQYVDWNTKADSWQDMFLMSACHHHIIANSSFSWWGAWLNDRIDKIVVCPAKWNADSPLDSDRVPKEWVKL